MRKLKRWYKCVWKTIGDSQIAYTFVFGMIREECKYENSNMDIEYTIREIKLYENEQELPIMNQ